MRIHSIAIENITSLKGKHSIDFDGGLHGEELFAITGPTGAGKSSILSAISLALYGKTYKGSLASNDFVTTGQPHAYVSLSFSLAGKDYRANWSIKVLKKNGEPVKNPKPQRELICEGVALEQTSISDILGLDFDQFCKTIILNQGEFAKFLHSSFRERKDIIEKLYRTQELSQITKNLKEKVKHEEAELKLKLLSFEKALPYTDEEITVIQTELKSKTDILRTHDALNDLFNPAYTSLTHLYTKLKEERDYIFKRNESEARLKVVIEDWNKVKTELIKTKQAYEAACQTNKNEVPKLRQAIKFQTNLEHTSIKLTELNEELTLKCKKKISLEADTTKKKELSSELKKELAKISNAYRFKELFQLKSKNEIYAFKEDIQKLKTHLQEDSRIKSQEEILLKQKDQQYTYLQKLLKQADELSALVDSPLNELESIILELRRRREANLSLWGKFEDSSTNLAKALEKEEELLNSISKLKNDLKEKSIQLKHAKEQQSKNKLTLAILECHKEVETHKECPVCHNKNLDGLIKPILENTLNESEISQLATAVDKLIFQIEENKSQLESTKDTLKDLDKLLIKNKTIIFPHYKDTLEWKTKAEVMQGLKVLKELYLANQSSDLKKQEELTENKSKIEYTKKEIENSNKILESLKVSHQELKDASFKVKNLVTTFLNNWKSLFSTQDDAHTIVTNFEHDNDLFNEYIQKEQQMSSNEDAAKSLHIQLTDIIERLDQIEKESAQKNDELIDFKKKVSDICKDKNPIELLESYEKNERLRLKSYQSSQNDYNNFEKQKGNEEQSIRIFSEQICDLQNLQKSYIKKLKDSFTSLSEFEDKIPEEYPLQSECIDIIKASRKWINVTEANTINDLLPILEARLDTTWTSLMEQIKDVSLELKTSVHTNKKRIEEYNTKLKDRSGLEEELKIAKNSLQIKNRLLEVFGKDEFRSYALGLLEKELVLGANQELNDLCDGRYQLQLLPGKGGAMEFFVLDQWRESSLRKINTLSGGETFLVSLAMALALAELTRGQNEIDSFFIDEGFGHLDVDSIDEVLEVLMNIQNRGKQIGIISHVKALTDRIPVNLTLQKSTLGESRAEFIYN